MIGYSEHAFQQVWGSSSLRLTGLRSDAGQAIDIIDAGRWNHLGGPDFLDAKVVIDGTLFVGAVELHLKPGEWYLHGHHMDPSYNCVVLHASPMPTKRAIIRADGTRIPHVNIGRVLPSWLPARSANKHALACGTFIQSHLDALNSQLKIAGSRYFEELAERHLLLARYGCDPSSEILRSIFIRSCSILGAPANRDEMTEMALVLWDTHASKAFAEPAQIPSTASMRLTDGRPASRPKTRMIQALSLLSALQMIEPQSLIHTHPKVLMQKIVPTTVGAQTAKVLYTSVLLPALWVHATLKGETKAAASLRSKWDATTLPPSPSASKAFSAVVHAVDKKLHKALTWQERNLCSKRQCLYCNVGNRMLN